MLKSNHHLRLFAAIIFPIFLFGCLPKNQPSEEQIQRASKQHFNQQMPSLLEAVQAIKLNGYKQNDTHYVAEMKIIAKAKQSLADYAGFIAKDPSVSAFEKIALTMQIGVMKMTMSDFKKGDLIEFEKNYLFIKTDNGWLLKKELSEDNN